MNHITHLFKHRYRAILFPLVILAAFAISGCQPGTAQRQVETHTLTGVVISIDREHNLLTVKHDAIPGKMEAMTMPFSPANPAALNTLHKGDKISAEMSIQANGAVLDNIKVIKD